jgi:hypothetical protein
VALDNLRRQTQGFHRQLKSLGFKSYDDYLKSPRWAKTRAKWRGLPGNGTCYVCKTSKHVPPHHASYERLGHERIQDGWRGKADIIPLCSKCHVDVHRLIDQWIRKYGDITSTRNLSTAHLELRKRRQRSLLKRLTLLGR